MFCVCVASRKQRLLPGEKLRCFVRAGGRKLFTRRIIDSKTKVEHK